MEKLIEKLFVHLKQQTGLASLPFNGPAAIEAITSAEQELRCKLPADYKDFLRVHDGQSDPFTLTFPPDDIAFLSNDLNAVDDNAFYDTFDTTGRVRNVLYHRGRIPIAYNEVGGAYLMIDNVPGPKGKVGQLVFNPNEVDVVVVADNLTGLFENYVQLLDAGRMFIRKQPQDVGEGFWFVSAGDERLDWRAFQSLLKSA
jgi:cell wall assembly regulator SMI1